MLDLAEAAPCHLIGGSRREDPLSVERLSGACRRLEAVNQQLHQRHHWTGYVVAEKRAVREAAYQHCASVMHLPWLDLLAKTMAKHVRYLSILDW